MLLDTFIKTYGDRTYVHVTSLRHKGSLIALAMDSTRRIFYSVLNLNGSADLGPLDVNYWSETPVELIFPTELTQVGIGVADQTRLPQYKKGSATPLPAGAELRPDELDVFRSTTARLSALAPFQALSDGRYVYIFRQAVSAADPSNVQKLDAKGNPVQDAAGNSVALVDSTLLVDRFVLSGTQLQPKMEVRYQRSRSRSRPQSRKDSLGAKDMQDVPFFEPTQELGFIGNLDAGRFSALLLPTQVAGLMRWQIFTENKLSGMVDSYNVERSADGLFNTRGTQAPTFSGSAESALYFGAGRHLRLATGPALAKEFSIEAWIKLDEDPSAEGDGWQALLGADTEEDKDAGPRILVNPKTCSVRAGFGNGEAFVSTTSSSILVPGSWSHLAIGFDGKDLRIYLDGMLRWQKNDLASQVANGPISRIGAATAGFKGFIDELRIWARARGERQIGADMHQRLVGREPDLIAYWRCDEARGSDIYDQTDNLHHAVCARADGTTDDSGWVTSDAPIGETGAVQRASFRVAGRTVASGMSALLYYHQEEVAGGYGDKAPLKQAARVLLAFGSSAGDEKAKVAAIDFAVSADGRLAQIPDTLDLALLQEQVLLLPEPETQPTLGGSVIFGNGNGHHSGNGNDPAILQGVWRPRSAVAAPVGAVAVAEPVITVLGSGPTEREPIPATTAPKMREASISEALNYISALEQQNGTLSTSIGTLSEEIGAFSQAIEIFDEALLAIWAGRKITALAAPYTNQEAEFNTKIAALAQARRDLAAAETERRNLETALAEARATVYEHVNFGGRRLSLSRGFWGYTYLNQFGFNDLISSVSVSSWLTVTAYEHANRGGDHIVFTGTTAWVGGGWNDKISSIDVSESQAYRDAYSTARAREERLRAALNELIDWARQTRGKIDTTRQTKSGERQSKTSQRDTIRAELKRVRDYINAGAALPMDLVHIDPRGLSVAGAILDFAWTTDTPLLFDSATGSLGLYFRGSDDQFFVTYYQTLTQRARYLLNGDDAAPALLCSARSVEPGLDALKISVADGDSDDTCSVTISLNEITETWKRVPRDPAGFARVLNGLAAERGFVGLGRPVNSKTGVQSLALTSGLRRDLAAGDLLIIGQSQVKVSENPRGDGQALHDVASVSVTSAATSLPDNETPIYYVEYDYLNDARTTTIPSNLVAGSQLVIIQPLGERPVANIAETSGAATISCQWTASAPGYTLSFDDQPGANGTKSIARSMATDLSSFAAPRDVTLEAWVRPGDFRDIGRVLVQRSKDGSYGLGLRRESLATALPFETRRFLGNMLTQPAPSISIGAHKQLALADALTIEAWVQPNIDPDLTLTLFSARLSQGTLFLRIRDAFYEVGVEAGAGSSSLARARVSDGDLNGNTWIHLVGTYNPQDKTWRLYRNGDQIAGQAVSSAPALGAIAGATIGAITVTKPTDPPIPPADPSKTKVVMARIDEVRLWKRARSQADIRVDQYRRLGGNETDLVANWRFDDGVVRDYGRYGIAGAMNSFPAVTPAESPVPAYSFFAQVGATTQRATQPFFGGSWTHLAAAYHQSYALAFGGGYVDCGTDTTLNLSQDLTVEVFFSCDNINQTGGLISRGMLDDGGGQDVPYALYLQGGRLVFAFEDVKHQNRLFSSDTPLAGGQFHRVSVTRERHVVREDEKNAQGQVIGVKVSQFYAIRMYDGKTAIGSWKYSDADPGSSDGALVIGRAAIPGGAVHSLAGTISEARVWTIARDANSVGSDIRGNERGLVSWWRFEENEGTIGYDAKSKNHGRLRGNVSWVKNPEPGGSQLVLYRDGIPQNTETMTGLSAPNRDQFSLGALDNTGASGEHFAGELEEVRVWQVTRAQEQIQDNLFRRLMGEREDLIAYYPFDTEKEGDLTDNGNRANHLKVSAASYVLSTAPIGTDTPQVRSALAGLRTSFNGLISGRPAVAEYGDVQYDAEGELSGVLKRGYALVQDGRWKLITGFKVGNLVAEWIGQIQFDPQLIGYIESAPPVPGENLTGESSYSGASAVEIVAADRRTFTYSSSRDSGFDMNLEASIGAGADSLTLTGPIAAPLGVGVATLTSVLNVNVSGDFRTSFENSLGWLEDASTSSGVVTNSTTRMELRGAERDGRFVPDSTGLALVQSETADVFALRLKHNRALVSFQMRPNPDIPKDWNIIPFRLNRNYVKQGTLDGRLGLDPDEDYPNALGYSPDRSFFKPIEAYALKNRIRREEEELKAFFDQYDAGSKGRREADTHFSAGDLATGRSLEKLPRREKRNLVNTYVWTADGGLFAETEETMDVLQETVGGSYAFTGLAGGNLSVDFAVMTARLKFEMTAMFGGHLNLTVQKTAESERSFGLNIDIGAIESDINQRTAGGALILEPDPSGGLRPKREPGKVDAYRFMSFYLEPRSDHFDTFFNQVVDPIWLEQSDEPNAQALREARSFRQDGRKPACWRVMHRVTFVSRVLPEFEAAAPASIEKTMREIDIDSNYELIKLLDPFVGDKTTDYGVFVRAVSETIRARAPELIPHIDEIIQYLVLYYDIPEDARLAAAADIAAPSLGAPGVVPLRIDAGPDQIVRRDDADTTLRGSVAEGSAKPDSLFAAWTMVEGPQAPIFAEPYALATKVKFNRKGRYVLRLSASDGQTSSADDVAIRVYAPPLISAGDDIAVGPDSVVSLVGSIDDNGLPEGETASVKVSWEKLSGPGDAIFAAPNNLRTTVTFTSSGAYLLRLNVDNDHYRVSDDVTVAVAARVNDSLLALYSFAAAQGQTVYDVSGGSSPLNLDIADAAAVSWISKPDPASPNDNPLGLLIKQPVRIAGAGSAATVSSAIARGGAFSLEVWVNPQPADSPGLLRIVSLAAGPTAGNLTLGQIGGRLYAAVRTSATDPAGSDRALVADSIKAGELSQVVLTREAATGQPGTLRLYLNGVEVGRRPSEGDLSAWDTSYPLSIAGGAWRGAFHLLAIYSRALSPAEIAQNYKFGADTNLPPIVLSGGYREIDLTESIVLNGIILSGQVLDDRTPGTITTSWTQISGPTAVEFADSQLLNTSIKIGQGGDYRLRLSASDGNLSSSSDLRLIVNEAPEISDAMSQVVILPAGGRLSVTVNRSGLGSEPDGWQPTISWQQISAGSRATIANPAARETAVSFTEPGAYRFSLLVGNGRPALSRSAEVEVLVHAMPSVQISAPALVNLPDTLALTGTVISHGRGDGDRTKLLAAWSKLSGPGHVSFSAPTALQTTASFSQSGVYKLRLSIDNQVGMEIGLGTADIEIVANAAPVVDAGPDLHVSLTAGAQLEGAAGDDGLPEQPGRLILSWSKASGPDGKEVAFENPAAGYTMAHFKARGRYVLRLTATDGAASSSDDLTVLVSEAPKLSAPRAIFAAPKGAPITLSARIEDSGLAEPAAGKLTATWQLVTGAGTIEGNEPAPGGEIQATLSVKATGRYTARLLVSNGAAESSLDYTILVDSRVHEGLLALYPFVEGAGPIVHQAAGTTGGTPLDLQIDKQSAARWEQGGGLKLLSATKVVSPALAVNPLTAAIKATKALSIEVWVDGDPVTSQVKDSGRVVVISKTYNQRNIILQRGSGSKPRGAFFQARIRTSTTTADDGQINLISADETTTGRRHIVHTFNEATGKAHLYIDGKEVAQAEVSGALAAWSDDYQLCLGNDPDGNRPWFGTYYLVAIYGRALSAEEVSKNFAAGTP